MFSKVELTKKTNFLDQTKAAREDRASEKHKDSAAILVQALARRYLVRCRLNKQIRVEVDKLLQIPSDAEAEYKPSPRPAVEVFLTIEKFFLVFKDGEDQRRFEYLCKYILNGMDSDTTKHQYVTLALNKEHVIRWIQQLKQVLWRCCSYLRVLKPESPSDKKMIAVCLRMLITFTCINNWKIVSGKAGEALKPGMVQLCNNVMGYLHTRGLYPCLQSLLMHGLSRSRPSFKSASMSAIITVALRPLMGANFSDNLLTVFLLHILSVPAIIHHISTMAQECLSVLMTHRVFKKSLDLLCNEQSTRIVFHVLEGNYALCLLANLIHLGNFEIEGLVENTLDFMFVVTRLLQCCKKYVQSKKSNLTHWHPVLGWFAQKTDQSLNEAMPDVVRQVQMLWSGKMIRLLYEPLFTHTQLPTCVDMDASSPSPSKNIFKKAFEKASSSSKSPSVRVKMDSPVLVSTCTACGMYLTAIHTLTQLRLDVLAGLCCGDVLLPRLWKLITDLGPQCGLRAFSGLLAARPNDTSHILFHLLQLSCDTASHIITILDDTELYEQDKPFTNESLVTISYFLNQLIVRIIWNGHLDIQLARTNNVFNSSHSLLMILYDRNSRRAFAPLDHWLIKDLKGSASIISEMEKGKPVPQFLMQKVPHIIPHKERVILFRKKVSREKEALGVTESACISPQSTLITVHRARMIEDGYRQLAMLPPNALKGLIRVKFINEQGLDEAGIDQDGVFKEFLEEIIKRVFNPSLNLFRVTDEQKLYPSPISYMQENYLALFEFVGRMLGKAVYEGIVVEVPFAQFFLSQILGQQHSASYSSIDELPSLDRELYNSLTYLKHYDGDVATLDLTFSYDEDVMGKLITHELIPGGRAIQVTNENKISYVHLMAHFKMRVQIKEQTAAFIHGFRSIVSAEWLQMFSCPELQKLISGATMSIDLEDLRKHTQYYGGFHNSHKVISWLWDILKRDFTPQEHSLFLKFVTSCSKPPLLGFAHLEPPFSIRCVEVSDEQDTGDTVGSVLKGFFNIRKKDPVGRLPTSSTCFNLLKLPNYQKKNTLREKLRYAITSNTGFELS